MRIVAPVDVSPSNECVLEPSLNDYTAVDIGNSEVCPQPIQSPKIINLDDSEQSNVQSNSNPFMCAVIDLTEESDSEPQQCSPPNNEPANHSQTSIASTQVRVQLEACSSVTVDDQVRISIEATSQGPVSLLPNSSANAVCSVTETLNVLVQATIVVPSSVLSSPENGNLSNIPSNSNSTAGHLLPSSDIQSSSSNPVTDHDSSSSKSSSSTIDTDHAPQLVITAVALQPQFMLNRLKMTFIASAIQLQHPLVSSLLTNLVENTTKPLTLALDIYIYLIKNSQAVKKGVWSLKRLW